ncbi:MAG: ATP-binding protein [Candidatus Riflebacteria bacterium]|nr:ATP-binding protein [Candidatus Riflebacteria bacterium]
MYIKRHIEQVILETSEQYPVIMVCGQRQVGKSTMLNHIKDSNRKYVTLDDANARRLAEQDPELFFETYGSPLLIDEFQRVPSILLEIKHIVDKKQLNNEDCNGLFWLTGSQKFKMMKNVSESLAGRVAVFELSSLSESEKQGNNLNCFNPSIDALKELVKSSKTNIIQEIYTKIFEGCMPKLVSQKINRDRFYSDYVNTYLERDIYLLEQVGKLNDFYNFLAFMAARTAQELNYSEISKELVISAPTVKEWVTILERSGIIFVLHPWYSNISKRLVKTPKVYFMDTGLAAYLCRWPTPETLESGAMDGAFFETFVISEIVKSFYNSGKRADLYYYRDIDKKEIDLIINIGNALYPIEIKKSKQPNNPDKNFSVLKKFNMEIKPGLVICMADDLLPYNKTTWLCPVSLLF